MNIGQEIFIMNIDQVSKKNMNIGPNPYEHRSGVKKKYEYRSKSKECKM